jgi:GNAT superfamily N-acetyltransferase
MIMTSSTSKAAMGAKAVRTNFSTTLAPTRESLASMFFKWALPNSQKYTITALVHDGAFLIPIRALGANHRELISRHLISLNSRDRFLRFGYFAKDQKIEQYVTSLDFDHHEIFGIFDRSLLLIAVAHLAYGIGDICDTGAEFGVSVLPHARGRGYGARLFEYAVTHASNKNISLIFIHALSENEPMLRIVTNAGARVNRHGFESEAFIQLPDPTLKSRLSEFVKERVAQADYHIKVRTHRTSRLSANQHGLPKSQRQ